ncbi:DUF4115 domain-containing protein [Psychromonas sp. CD1]|uniref:DUF4115 domain-containing protein n=1 Tax=Psychromonas sp. CD1 TaxID=1979839 RepID=UPI0015DA0E69|nr:DUF4115 domain-containing protein [Psychromonas sp. CD1]
MSVKSEHIVKKENERKSKIIPVSSTETIVASLLLTYSADCWTEIKDAENKRVAFGLYEKGRVLTLQGVPPFQLTLGDPSVVAIQYQHEIVTYKFDAGKRAVFTLPMT